MSSTKGKKKKKVPTSGTERKQKHAFKKVPIVNSSSETEAHLPVVKPKVKQKNSEEKRDFTVGHEPGSGKFFGDANAGHIKPVEVSDTDLPEGERFPHDVVL